MALFTRSVARAWACVMRGAIAAAGGSVLVALKLFESSPASDGVSRRLTGGVSPVNRACSLALRVTPAPDGWPPWRWRTSTSPVMTVNRVVNAAGPGPACAVVWSTSTITMVPRMLATAFGVRISIVSPGFMRSLATAIAARPTPMLTVETPGTSVIVSDERSRTVTIALPPSRMRATESSPVLRRSCTKTSSLNFSGTGCDSDTRATVAVPCSVVTTPALVG